MSTAFFTSPEFRNWQWRVAVNIRSALEDAYAQRGDELAAVRAIIEAGAIEPGIRSTGSPNLSVGIESGFIHGDRSQVRFEVGKEPHQCELGDLLMLGTYVEDGSLRWQRVCFVQAKRSSAGGRTSPCRFGIDKWQLALLRAFPRFQGISGIFKGQCHHLRNTSGMLGAYGLLSSPGDLSVVSARILDQVLGGRQSLSAKELIPAFLSDSTIHHNPATPASLPVSNWWPFDPENCIECREYLDHFFPFPHSHYWRHHQHHIKSTSHQPESIFPHPSVQSCISIDNVIQSWSSLRLGEIWHPGVDVQSDRSLAYSVWQIVSYLHQRTHKLSTLVSMLRQVEAGTPPTNNAPDMSSSSREPSAIGVISVTITSTRGD